MANTQRGRSVKKSLVRAAFKGDFRFNVACYVRILLADIYANLYPCRGD